jgi:glycerol-3-phosphate acyltransferase PlsY
MDATKGALAVWVAGTLMGTTAWAEASGIATVAGHVFPLWAKFRGGKGVATAIGALLVLSTTAACALIGLWMLVLSVTRYVSLASVIAAAALPVAATFLRAGITVFAYVVAAMIILRHRENLVRLWHGNEAKLGARSR